MKELRVHVFPLFMVIKTLLYIVVTVGQQNICYDEKGTKSQKV